MSDDPTGSTSPRPAKRFARRLGRVLLLTLGPVVVAGAGSYYYMTSGRYVITENAYIKMDKVAISADVSGHVEYVGVQENDFVEKGQILFRLDPERYRIALDRRKAEFAVARAGVEALRAVHRQKLAEFRVANHDVDYYQSQFERAAGLQKKGYASQAKFDKAKRDWLMSKQKIEAIRQDIAGVRARLGGDIKMPTIEHPLVLEALADRDRALLDLKRTAILAPQAGTVTNIELQVGEYVAAGRPVFSIVSAEPLWIEANLKETDLTYVREGQQARVEVDAYPDREWPATVVGISPATGAEFSLLPPQNASGNWVKVVQRLPVRLVLQRRPDDPPLRAGMSVRVAIDTGHERVLPGFIDSALAWAKERL